MDYRTEQLRLRFVTEDDLAEVARTWPSDHHPLSEAEARGAIAYMQANHGENGRGRLRHLCLAVCRAEAPGTILGWCGLDGGRSQTEPELFVLLEEEARGKGYGTQCVRELLRIAAEDFALPGVHGGCDKENVASRRVMEKGGMVQYGAEENGDPLFRYAARFDLERYLDALIRGCRSAFGERLLYMGLQGSWLRGEAHEGSDIDVMAVLDRMTVEDMDRYRELLQSVGFYERSCGFLCGRDELRRWSPLETCQLRFTTKDLYGTLTEYLPPATRRDEIEYVRFSLGNLYQELCHRYVHADREKNAAKFRGTCKYVLFLVQNLYYLESGRFLLTRQALKEAVPAEDRQALELSELPDGFDFGQAFAALYAWCQRAFARLEKLEKENWNCKEKTE